MKKRTLGKSGHEVSALGLGSMGLSHGGTAKLHRLEENLGGADVELTSDNLASTEKVLAAVGVQGDRNPAHLAARVGR